MKPTPQQLSIINSRLPGHTLKATDVEVLPFMVFDTKRTDRFTIMSVEMMNKLAQDLNGGRAAFNKMHESRENLPVGASVTGRIKEREDGEGKELHAMMYAAMRRPDGTVFEEGKDLVDRYSIGAVRACSAGVQVGFYKCNICGNDVRSWNDCDHIPGREYTVDEQPKVCIALMTGHKIVNGVAEDCGIYEVSAVTAGGVAAAGALTEAFGRYEDGADPKEFKKSVINEKGIDMRLEFSAAPNPGDDHSSSEEESNMDLTKEQVKVMMAEHYDPLKLANDKLKDDYTTLQTSHTELNTEFGVAKEEIVTLKSAAETSAAEFAQVSTDLETAKEEAIALAGFKAEYISVVLAQGIKAGEELVEAEFSAKPLEELKELSAAYTAKIALLPEGQQTGEPAATAAASIDDQYYKA